MASEDVPTAAAVATLCRRCREETARYRRGEAHDDRWCLEVFRRAVEAQDQFCWRELHEIYRDLVQAWCRPVGSGLLVEPEDLVSLTWQKFWRSYNAGKLGLAGSTAAVLAYLRMCAHSVAVDEARGQRPTASLEAAHGTADDHLLPGDVFARQAAKMDLWEIINRQLRDERERALMYLTYELGMRSAEVQAARPDLFATVQDVYRITRNVLDRLKRSRELREWFGQDDA
jgi:hypothetical protein